MRSTARWGRHQPRRLSRHGLTSSNGRRIDVWRSRTIRPRFSTFGTFSRSALPSLRSLIRIGGVKGYLVTRQDCSTYGHHFPLRQSSLTFPGPHSSPPRLLLTRNLSTPGSPLSLRLPSFPRPTHLLFQACSRCTSGEETTSITVNISPTGPRPTWASTSCPGCQTGSPDPRPPVLLTTGTASICHQKSKPVTAGTAFPTLNRSFRACARCARSSCRRRSSRACM